MKAIGVHIFAGGFSLGVEKHFKLLGHLERGDLGVKSWRAWRPHVPVHIAEKGDWDLSGASGPVDFVYGNPPCASWSQASTTSFRYGDSLSADWGDDVVRVGAAVSAPVTVIESVRGAAAKGAEAYRAIAKRYGMQLSWVFVNAKDHGLPQERKRVFIVFTKGGVFVPEFAPQPPVYVPEVIAGAPVCPPPDPNLVRHSVRYKITAQDVLDCIPLLKGGQTLLMVDKKVLKKASPKIARYLAERKDHMPFGGGGAQIVRCPVDKPTRTVFGVGVRFVHPTEDRLLTMAELMRLNGYPDGFPWFEQNMGEQHRTMGKSVCPPVGAWIAGEVAAHLRGERDVRHVQEATFWCASDGRPRIVKSEETK